MARELSAFREQVLVEIRKELARGRISDDDLRLSPEETAGQVAARMLRGRPSHDETADDLIGPFYDEPGVERLLGVKRQQLTTLRNQKLLLGITGTSGRPLYPSFQFGPSGELLPEMPAIRDILDPVLPNDMTVARWLTTPSPRYDGRTAAQLLFAGDTEPVLAAARDDANRMAH